MLLEPEAGFVFALEECFELDLELGFGLCLEPELEGFWVELELEDLWPDSWDLEGFFSLGGYSSLGSLTPLQLVTPGNSSALRLDLSLLRPLVATSN